MIPELFLLSVGALGMSGLGAAWWMRRAQRNHVIRVQTAWVHAGQIVLYGPVGAVCLGNRPRHVYGGGVFGALGITDGRLVFDGHRNNTANVSVSFDRIRHIGLTTVPVLAGKLYAQRRALTVHYASPDGWRVATFLTETPVELAQELGDEGKLPVYDSGSAREDFGPARAMRMFQDLYGEWRADRRGDLYLAPDRLLFAWRDEIPLAAIRRLDVYRQGGRLHDLSPFSRDLLRIEYGESGDDFRTVGFVVRHADRWTDAIQHRASTPLDVHAGRKKKNG
jgi:hypothetical protein